MRAVQMNFLGNSQLLPYSFIIYIVWVLPFRYWVLWPSLTQKKHAQSLSLVKALLKFVKEHRGTKEQLYLFPPLTSQSTISGNEQELTLTLSTRFTFKVCVYVDVRILPLIVTTVLVSSHCWIASKTCSIFVMLYLYFASKPWTTKMVFCTHFLFFIITWSHL